jgi:hypothetical protein
VTLILDAGPLVALADEADPLQGAIEQLLSTERGALVIGQLHFDDGLDSSPAELDGHAYEQAIDSVFAVEVRGTGQDLVAVVEDRVDHLGDRCGRGA